MGQTHFLDYNINDQRKGNRNKKQHIELQDYGKVLIGWKCVLILTMSMLYI